MRFSKSPPSALSSSACRWSCNSGSGRRMASRARRAVSRRSHAVRGRACPSCAVVLLCRAPREAGTGRRTRQRGETRGLRAVLRSTAFPGHARDRTGARRCGAGCARSRSRLRHRYGGRCVGDRAGAQHDQRHRSSSLGRRRSELDLSRARAHGACRARHDRPGTDTRPAGRGYPRGIRRQRAARRPARQASPETARCSHQGLTRSDRRADRKAADRVVGGLGAGVHRSRRSCG